MCRPTSHWPGIAASHSCGTSASAVVSKESGASCSGFQKVQVWNSVCFSQRRCTPPRSVLR